MTNSSGIATFAVSGFASIAHVDVVTGWNGTQMLTGGEIVANRTLTSIQVQGVRSRGTLLLSAGPFEVCPAGVTLKIVVFGTAG